VVEQDFKQIEELLKKNSGKNYQLTFGGGKEESKDARIPTEIEEDIMDRDEENYAMDDIDESE
jgi:hypothetical protein